MYITNITDDYNDTLSINKNCTNNDNNIDIIIPALLFITPCGLSFLCLIYLMVYTLIKTLFNKKSKYEYIQLYMYLYLVYLSIYE